MEERGERVAEEQDGGGDDGKVVGEEDAEEELEEGNAEDDGVLREERLDDMLGCEYQSASYFLERIVERVGGHGQRTAYRELGSKLCGALDGASFGLNWRPVMMRYSGAGGNQISRPKARP